MMFGKKKRQAEQIWNNISELIRSTKYDKDVFPDGPGTGVAGPCMGMCCFILSGFFGEDKIMYEIVAKYRDGLIQEVGREDAMALLDRMQFFYSKFREIMIAAQDNNGNNPEELLRELAVSMAAAIDAPDSDTLYPACLEYVATFIKKTKSILEQ